MSSSTKAYLQGAWAILAVTVVLVTLTVLAFNSADKDRQHHTIRHEACVEAGFAGYERYEGCVGERRS